MNKYYSICQRVESEFARNRERYGKRMRCGPGCSDCCHQLFQITEIEAAHVSEGVSELPRARRRKLEERARRYTRERRQLIAATGEPEAWGSLPPPGARLACPALEDGICAIYEHRPLICRRFGMPLFNPDKPGRLFACELNFRDGEAIDDPDLVQIQTAIHRDWKQLQADYNQSGGHRDPEPITVACAILISANEDPEHPDLPAKHSDFCKPRHARRSDS